MKQHNLRTRALMAASAIVAAPALAQNMTPAPTTPAAPAQTAPMPTPPVVAAPTFPQNDTGAAPASRQAAPRASSSIGDPASATPVNPAAIAAAQEEATQRRAAARPMPRAATPRAAPRRAARVAARPPVAPVAAPAPAPVTPTPAPVEPAPVAVAPAPVPSAAATPLADQPRAPAPTEAADRGGIATSPLAILGLLVLAAGAFFLMRRRRVDDVVYEEPVAIDPASHEPVVAAPVMPIEPVRADPVIVPAAAVAAPVILAAETGDDAPAAPAVPDDVNHIAVEEDELAALTAAAPVGDRPWLEFALRPVRAGSNVDEALVEIDLTVGNAGQVAAHDVRIATFMLATRQDDELRRLLAVPPANAGIEPVTIEPGAGTRVEATLAVLKADLAGRFDPIVVVDARYTLADGSEGRTSAAFTVGVVDPETGATGAIDIARPELFDDVEATLYREPEHA